jgi:hypothetical protein
MKKKIIFEIKDNAKETNLLLKKIRKSKEIK